MIDALVCKSTVSVSVIDRAATHRRDQAMSSAPAQKKKDMLRQQHTQIGSCVCLSVYKKITVLACNYAVYLKVLHALWKVLHAFPANLEEILCS